MSEYAEGHRKANKDKANRLAGGKPEGAIDASGWKPEGEVEPLHSEKKVGKQPKPRAYKRGGHVEEKAHHHAGRAKRKARMGGGPLGGESAVSDPTVASAVAGATQNRAGVAPNRMNFGPGASSALHFQKGGLVDKNAVKKKIVDQETRSERKAGGRTGKGKMNVNIIIAQPGHGGEAQPQAPQPPAAAAPHPIPTPAPAPAPVPQQPMPGGMPMGGGAGMPMGGQMPMPRKHGGRTYPIEHSAAGGKGRLEKAKAYGEKPLPGQSV